MHRIASLLASTALLLGAATPGCGRSEPTVVPDTMTNAQGCTRKRQMGPQDPAATPPPLMDACLGPYKLRIPANYFDDQMGPYFDGSFSLNLEYPGLAPFAPGERTPLKLDVATRTVAIRYDYLDRVEPAEFIYRLTHKSHDTSSRQQQPPEDNLETRIAGEPVYGLVPHYADPERIAAYYRARNFPASAPVMQPAWHEDWFVAPAAADGRYTFIRCTSHRVNGTGVEFRQGRMARKKNEPLPMCTHTTVLPGRRIAIEISYVRAALPDWKRIQQRAITALEQFSMHGNTGRH